MGVMNPPESVDELSTQMATFLAEAKPDERVREAVRFLRRPPLPRELRWPYRVLFAGAAASLPQKYRRLLGLRRPPWPAITATRALIAFVRWRSGAITPSERFARERLVRLEDARAQNDQAAPA